MIRREDLGHLGLLYARFARPYVPTLLAAGLLSMIAACLATMQPLVLAPAIDSALGTHTPPAASWGGITLNNVGATLLGWAGSGPLSGTWGAVAVVVAVYVGVVLLTNVIAFGNLLLVNWIKTSLFRDMQSAVYRHLLGLSMSYFVRQRTGDLASRLINDAYQTAHVIDSVVRGLVQGGAQLAVYAFLLMHTDAWLTIGVLAVFAMHLAITRGLLDRIRRLVVDQFDLFAELTSLVQEAVQSIRVVKSFGAERFEHVRFMDRAHRLAGVFLKGGIFKYAETPLRDVADALGLGLVLLMAFAALRSERLSVAGLVLFVVLVRQALVPVSQVDASVLSLQSVIGSSTRLVDVLTTSPAVPDGVRDTAPLRDAIRLHDVRFAYQPGADVIRGVTLEIRRGEMVALVGPSGAGKSTLADLVVRLYDPTGGRVTYDGVDIREFRQESYRRHFGVVSQECLLFNATLAENITYGRPLDSAAVRRAARIGHVDEFTSGLRHGYDTVVGDRGVRLSGGQRQRVAIARAVYARPAVLVLDEATSSLDSESEQQVQTAIEELAKDVTVLVIAHRLSTVVKADKIIVMSEGKVDAVGAHHELIETCALYRRLCEAQFHELAAPVG